MKGTLSKTISFILIALSIAISVSAFAYVFTNLNSDSDVSDSMKENMYDFSKDVISEEVFEANNVTGVKFEKKDLAEYEKIGKNVYKITGIAYDVKEPSGKMEYKVVVSVGKDKNDKNDYEYSWFVY